MARKGSDDYTIEIGVAPNVATGELVSTFYIPAPYHCGGIGRLNSVGASLVYDETLLFGTLANCIGAGRATLTPAGAALAYSWSLSGRMEHRGTVNRRNANGASVVPATALGLWQGNLDGRVVHLLIAPSAVGGALAHVLYSSTGDRCGAILTLTSAAAGGLVASETLTSTGTNCRTGGTVTLRPSEPSLQMTWSAPGVSLATTLDRAR